MPDWSTHEKHHKVIRRKTIFFTTKYDTFEISLHCHEKLCPLTSELSSVQEEADDTNTFLPTKLAQ